MQEQQTTPTPTGNIAVGTATPPAPVCTVQLISQTTFQAFPIESVIELQDMGIVSRFDEMQSFVRLVKSPAINAQRVGYTIPWGTTFTVLQRVVFPQLDPLSGSPYPTGQIWYEVQYAPQPEVKGWLIVRYEGQNYLTEPDKCAGIVPEPTTLTFYYDRGMASHYAIEHSYDTAVAHGLLQGQGRVTQRIPQPASFFLPYAYFRYSGVGQSTVVTGSALFVSESLWMGGMPMTWGDTDSCRTAGGDSKGWRYCHTNPLPSTPPPPTPTVLPFGEASNTYDSHGDFVGYWAVGPSTSPHR